jgi:hypothetical protein
MSDYHRNAALDQLAEWEEERFMEEYHEQQWQTIVRPIPSPTLPVSEDSSSVNNTVQPILPMNIMNKSKEKFKQTNKVDPDADVRRTAALGTHPTGATLTDLWSVGGDDAGSATEGRNLVRPSVVLRNVVEASNITYSEKPNALG